VFTSTVTKNQQKKEEQHFQIKVLPKHVSFTLSILLLDLVFPRFPLNQQKAIRCIFSVAVFNQVSALQTCKHAPISTGYVLKAKRGAIIQKDIASGGVIVVWRGTCIKLPCGYVTCGHRMERHNNIEKLSI